MYIKHSFHARFICVLLAFFAVISVFFYSPVEADAQVSVVTSAEILEKDNALYNEIMPLSVELSNTVISCYFSQLWGSESETYDFSSYLTEGNGLYEVNFKIDTTFTSSRSDTYFRNMNTYMNCSGQYQQLSTMNSSATSSYSFSANRKFYIHSSTPEMTISYKAIAFWTTNPGTVTLSGSYSISNISVTKVNQSSSKDYENGYNAGYSDGETAGYGNGYSSGFADGEASVDTGAIYDEAFQAGKESVDTQSYYDAGYQAGYQVAYQEGYASGYDEGYQSVMDRLDGWGADSSDYPIELTSALDQSINFRFIVSPYAGDNYNYKLLDSTSWRLGCDFNPNHTYKIVFVLDSYDVSASTSSSNYHYDLLRTSVLNGSNIYPFSLVTGKEHIFYIPGDIVSNAFLFQVEFLNFVNTLGDGGNIGFYLYFDAVYDFYIYDCGPSGDTQNHIANQTDQLTHGYDSSAGSATNTQLKGSVDSYGSMENTLFDSVSGGLSEFEFFDFNSVPAMITGLSFIGAIMQSWFYAAGGASGVGIVLSVLFSVMLVAMALGLYRLYQNASHRKP